MRLNTKILAGVIAVNVLLLILSAFVFFVLRPAAAPLPTTYLAGGLLLLLLNSLACGLIMKNLALPLAKLTRHLENQAHSLEDSAGRLNGTAQAMGDNSARSSAALEEAAGQLSQVSGLILRGAGAPGEAREILTEINKLVSQANNSLAEIDTNVCLNTSASSDIHSEALQLSGNADELMAATDELAAIIHGIEAPDYREPSLKNKLARQVMVKSLPVADIS